MDHAGETERTGGRGRPNPVDVHVGSRLRLRRTLLGMSQEKLGEALGLTFQQVQKYERGANRIGASRLFELSRVLDVPVSFFFDEMSGGSNGRRYGVAEEPSEFERGENGARRDLLELARAFDRIRDDRVRKRILELTKSLVDGA